MIGESYVSFDTAKLLKEAGFDEPCRFCYSPCKDIRRKNYKRNSDLVSIFYSRPTQALAARWLREEKKIFIEVSMFWIGNWTYCIKNRNGVERKEIIYERRFRTYEKALEAGLREAIKLIKK